MKTILIVFAACTVISVAADLVCIRIKRKTDRDLTVWAREIREAEEDKCRTDTKS